MAVALYVKDDEENKPFSYLPMDMPRCHNYHPKDIAINEKPVSRTSSFKITEFCPFLFALTLFLFN